MSIQKVFDSQESIMVSLHSGENIFMCEQIFFKYMKVMDWNVRRFVLIYFILGVHWIVWRNFKFWYSIIFYAQSVVLNQKNRKKKFSSKKIKGLYFYWMLLWKFFFRWVFIVDTVKANSNVNECMFFFLLRG